jgi:hypothetical protein
MIFSENRLVYKENKGSKKPEVKQKPETVQVAPIKPETKDVQKAALEKKYQNAKDKLKGPTKDLIGSLKQNMTIEMLVKDIDSVKKLRESMKSAPIGTIEKLEDKYPGITLVAFTKNLKDAEKLDFKNWSSDKIYSKFKEKTKYEVDFLGNSEAENQWGMSDMLGITMRKVTKYEGGNVNIKRISQRRVGLKGQNKDKRGYYDNHGYMAIHTGDVFEFENSNPEFKDMFREKEGNRYKEIDEKSYEKYDKSKYAKEDSDYLEKQQKNWNFITKRASISNEQILAIREKIGNLKGLSAKERLQKVAAYLTKPENNIGARHCGDWVDRVYAIAGIKRKQTLYQNLNYAFIDGDSKKGWKPETDPSRYDCRIEGKYASEKMLDKLEVGDWVWINNRNKYDYAGNHSGIFLGWVGKNSRRAKIACWFRNKPGGQKITTYNFRNMPVTAIHKPTHVDDTLSEPNPEKKGTSPKESAGQLPDASKRDMVARGSTPFAIEVGYRLSKEESDWYDSVNREAYRLGRMNINQRLAILQERYKLMDALKYSAEMVGVRKKDMNYFIALNDAVLRVESNYNPYNFNNRKKRGTREITLSTAAGEYQILNSVWNGFKKYSENSKRGRYLRAQMKKYGINAEMLMKIDFSAPRPEFATPYQRCVLHNTFMFRYSRILSTLESVDNIFDKLRTTDGRTRRSWMRVVYLYWRNGPGGAAAFIRNLRAGIPLPESEDEMRDYFDNHLRPTDWQKRRGYRDFKSVMKTTKIFADRFQQNLDQLGA